ncbi:Uncharacterised protein [Vibrio cholerae]|uniref:Uncharacterized protein n=1 Tax=Vibrio cholerae TaxID=666 RepID=A0A655WMT7_VIBCL|nr:Uncharacterised protein [Vibrio cholerae]
MTRHRECCARQGNPNTLHGYADPTHAKAQSHADLEPVPQKHLQNALGRYLCQYNRAPVHPHPLYARFQLVL